MEHPSTTEGITIVEWNAMRLDWRLMDYAPHYATRNATGRVLITPRPGCSAVGLPAEFAAWLAGEGPPEPPIEVGARVRRVHGDEIGKVLCIDSTQAWVRWYLGNRATVSLSNLTVVDR